MEREKQTPPLPHGVSPIVRNFLLDCISYGAVSELMVSPRKTDNFNPKRNRNIIGLYFGSEATSYELAKMYGISRNRVTQIIKEGMLKMHSALPDEIRDKYSEEEILKMKTGHSPRTIERFIGVRKANSQPVQEKQKKVVVKKERPKKIKAKAKPRIKPAEKPKSPEEIIIEKYSSSTNGIISLSEVSLQNLIEEFIARERKKKRSVTAEDVCKHLQYMGISFDPEFILEMLK